jgi:hypothetical protein
VKRSPALLAISLILLLLVAACGGDDPTAVPAAPATKAPPTATAAPGENTAGDFDIVGIAGGVEGLVQRLRDAGATVEIGDVFGEDFFSLLLQNDPSGQKITVNDADLQVYEYTSEAMAVADSSQISPGGTIIGSSPVKWPGPPHFYRSGDVLVRYVGEDEAILALLNGALGKQIAGAR